MPPLRLENGMETAIWPEKTDGFHTADYHSHNT
jgi:hypothetical protein